MDAMQKAGIIMPPKEIIVKNIDKIHTTEMGIGRISRNLGISGDVVSYCKSKILKKESVVDHKGKNYYVHIDNCIITVNAKSYTIITAHIKNN